MATVMLQMTAPRHGCFTKWKGRLFRLPHAPGDVNLLVEVCTSYYIRLRHNNPYMDVT